MRDCAVCVAVHVAVNAPFGIVELFFDKKMVCVS